MLRSIALLLTLVTGFSGLVYQAAFQAYLAALLGSHSEATATVLGVFLGGLAVGYHLFGRVSRRITHARSADAARGLLLCYGAVEAAIGLYACAFPELFELARALSLVMPRGSEPVMLAIDLVFTIALVGPPTVLMGATIPLLTQGLPTSADQAARLHAEVYALNTAGAFAGALAAGFWIIPTLGLDQSMRAMAALNVIAGVSYALIARARGGAGEAVPPAEAEAQADGVTAGNPLDVRVGIACALLSGFAMMTLQTALNRLGALTLGASQVTFSIVVAAFIACIALGSAAVSRMQAIGGRHLAVSQWTLALWLLLLYPQIEDAPYYGHALRALFSNYEPSFYAYYGAVFASLLLVLGVPLALSGALLPLLFGLLKRERADLGRIAGRVYAWNTVGSFLGALLGGYGLLFVLDLHHMYRIAVLALALTAALLTSRFVPGARAHAGGALALTVIALAVYPGWSEMRLSSGLFRLAPGEHSFYGAERLFAGLNPGWRPGSILLFDDDPTATVTITEPAPRTARVRAINLRVNGKSDGSIPGDILPFNLIGLLPALLAERPSDVFLIGFGTGATAGTLAALATTRRIEVSEISPAVASATSFFEGWNQRALGSGKVHVTRGDAYRALQRDATKYDVIVAQPSNPWVMGVELLYSRELLAAAKAHLNPGGVYCQWFHTYDSSQPVVDVVLRTFGDVFHDSALWMVGERDYALLGFNGARHERDLARAAERFARPDYGRQFARIGIGSLPELLVRELLPASVLRATPIRAEIHTIQRPILSHMAGKAFFVGKSFDLPNFLHRDAARAGAAASLLGRLVASRGGALGESERAAVVAATCRHRPLACPTALARMQREHPSSPRLPILLREARAPAETAADRSDAVLGRLRRLLRPAAAPPPLDVLEAIALFEAFAKHYDHADPFDARAVRAALAPCAASDPRCAMAQAAATGLGTD